MPLNPLAVAEPVTNTTQADGIHISHVWAGIIPTTELSPNARMMQENAEMCPFVFVPLLFFTPAIFLMSLYQMD